MDASEFVHQLVAEPGAAVGEMSRSPGEFVGGGQPVGSPATDLDQERNELDRGLGEGVVDALSVLQVRTPLEEPGVGELLESRGQHVARNAFEGVVLEFPEAAVSAEHQVSEHHETPPVAEELRAAGATIGIAGKPVQVRNPNASGKSITDGPYLRSDLPVAGFALIEAESIEDAIHACAHTPCAVAHGVVEVWPLTT